jgi:hypothetical protein
MAVEACSASRTLSVSKAFLLRGLLLAILSLSLEAVHLVVFALEMSLKMKLTLHVDGIS